jgi:hypothetical protein
MDKRTVHSAHSRVDEIEKEIVAIKTEIHLQFKTLFNRVARLEMILIGCSAAIIMLLFRLVTMG